LICGSLESDQFSEEEASYRAGEWSDLLVFFSEKSIKKGIDNICVRHGMSKPVIDNLKKDWFHTIVYKLPIAMGLDVDHTLNPVIMEMMDIFLIPCEGIRYRVPFSGDSHRAFNMLAHTNQFRIP